MIKQALFGATVLAGLVGVAGVAHADVPAGYSDGKPADIATNQGNTDITFTGDTTSKNNNDDNSKYVNPNEAGDATTAGNEKVKGQQAYGLTLLQVPSFDFKTQQLNKIDTTTTTTGYTATGTGKYKDEANDLVNGSPVDGGIVVRDLRGGNSGYQVYAAASNLYASTEDGGYELPVASISMSTKSVAANGDLDDAIDGTGEGKFATVYTALNRTFSGSAQANNTDGKGNQNNDVVGRVAGYGNMVLKGNADTNGTYTSGATSLNLKLKNNKVKAVAYHGFVTFTLQDTSLNSSAAISAE